MQSKKSASVKFDLNLDMQVRTSKFTRAPRGKLEVVILEGHSLKYRNENYAKPIMEFKIDS